MRLARCTTVLFSLAILSIAACDASPKKVDASASSATQASGKPLDASVPPPVQTTGKPAYLSPRNDGTYVDVNGHILTPPPVMLGVTMEQPGRSLTKHLGINPARTTLLIDVIPGLPAAKAGLEDHDLVVAVDGSDDASPHDIRNRLKSMKAGDAITFTIRRGTSNKTVTLQAAAWQAEHMVRPIHAGSFSKPGLSDQADKDSAPRELAPIMDRLDRIEKQLQQLNSQVNTGQAVGAPVPPAAGAKPMPPAPPAKPTAPTPAPR